MAGERAAATRAVQKASVAPDASLSTSGPVLRFELTVPPATEPGERVVVVDTTWTSRDSSGLDGPIGLRDVAARVLSERDLMAETTATLDAWAAASGVTEAMTGDGTSFWFYYRLRHWLWLHQQLLSLGIVDRLAADHRPSGMLFGPGADRALVAAATLIGARDGIPVTVVQDELGTTAVAAGTAVPSPAATVPPPGAVPSVHATAGSTPLRGRTGGARERVRSSFHLGLRHVRHGLLQRIGQDDPIRRRRFVAKRIRHLARERGRLLVVLEHAVQRVETANGPRLLNAYLGPIVDQLRSSRLEPIEIDIRARMTVDDATWVRLIERGGERLLPADAIWLSAPVWPSDRLKEHADEMAARLELARAPVVVSGIDLGPALAAQVADETRRSLAGLLRNVGRIRRLLRRLRPAGLLLADEYHRQDWLAAARAEGIPTAAVQHGLIHRWHAGYIHSERPASLRLADRSYVFGRWERRLLLDESVYRDDEVRVGGSPRLDLMAAVPADRAAVRAELGVEPGDRMVLLAGTWGELARRYHYPIALAALVDRPLPRVHFVIKLHPGEKDQGPYEAVLAAVARARGFAPPPVTIIREADLYRLLQAADAHIGITSTVLTEAVVTRTPNLIVDFLGGADLLGYVEAGVARPIRTGGDLLAALDDPAGSTASEEARRRFLEAHFEPGDASRRIAADLLDWMR